MPKNAILLAVLVIVFTCIAAIPVYAGDLISAEDPDGILGIARGFGGANLEKDGAGDPLIVGRIDGTKYGVYFFGCSDGKNCSTIQFSAGWSGSEVSLSDLNQWNKNKVFGKAYLDDDGDPILQMSVNTYDGVSRKNLDDTFDWWAKVLKEFKKEVLEL